MLEFRDDDLSGPETQALLNAHLAHSAESTPDGFRFALDLDSLRTPDITFWTVWENQTLLGCGAMKEHGPTLGKIKSMHTASAHRRKGAAAAMVTHMICEAQSRGYMRLRLETGTEDGHAAARALYASLGFIPCDACGDYASSPHNTFMSLSLKDS
jgi:putative acetyltransferase